MRTAAVGDSPKIVVRSVTADRGRAEAPSSLFVVLLVLELERSELTLPDVLPPGAGVLSVPDALPLAPPGAGVLTLPDEELELDPGAGAGVAGADDPWASTSDTGAASTATPSRAANKAFIPHLLGETGSKGGATERAAPEGAVA
jgi:hypothetical protein